MEKGKQCYLSSVARPDTSLRSSTVLLPRPVDPTGHSQRRVPRACSGRRSAKRGFQFGTPILRLPVVSPAAAPPPPLPLALRAGPPLPWDPCAAAPAVTVAPAQLRALLGSGRRRARLVALVAGKGRACPAAYSLGSARGARPRQPPGLGNTGAPPAAPPCAC